MRQEPTRTPSDSERGQSELVGTVLLVGMVLAVVGIVLLTGSTAIDSFKDSAELGQVELTSESAAEQLTTVANDPDSVRSLPTDTSAQYNLKSDGELQVGWHNESNPNNVSWGSAPSNSNLSRSIELGALELDHDDVQFVHQGGSVWRVTESGTVVHSPPEIQYDGTRPRLNLLLIDDEGFDAANPTAAYDQQRTADAMEALNEVQPHPDRHNYSIRIESEYAEGWERAFEQQFDADSYENVTVERNANEVIVNIAHLNDGFETGPIVVAEDRGIQAAPTNTISEDETKDLEVLFRNEGFWEAEAEPKLEIYDPRTGQVKFDTTKSNPNEVELEDEGETEVVEFTLEGSQLKNARPHGLDPGELYEYNVFAGDMHELDGNGTFLFLHDEEHFEVTNLTVDHDPEEGGEYDIDITAEFWNVGENDGTADVELTLEDDEEVSTETAVGLDRAEATALTWTINETRWQKGDYNVTVETDDDQKTDDLTVDERGVEAVFIEEVDGIRGAQAIDEGDETFEVGAVLNNTFVEEETRDVTVTVYNDSAGDDQVLSGNDSVTIGAEETEQVWIDVNNDLDPGTYYYDIDTEDDSLESLGEFRVGDGTSELEIESTSVSVTDGDVVKPSADLEDRAATDLEDAGTLEVEVTVTDGDADEQFVWLEGFNGETVDVEGVEGTSGNVTLEWADATVPQGNPAVTVQTASDRETVDLDAEEVYEPRVDVADVSFETGEPGDEVDVTVELESVGGDADDIEVTFENQGEETIDPVIISSVHGYGTTDEVFEDQIELNDPTFTQYVTASTGDDEYREPLVVERDGPVCGADHVEYGTSEPYEVSNIDELQCINDEGLDADYELVSDIPAHGTKYWNNGDGFEPIGPEGNNYPNEFAEDCSDCAWDDSIFSGDFNGNDHEISDLHIDRPTERFVGLFGATSYAKQSDGWWDELDPGEGSTIRNVRLSNIFVHGKQHVGGLVGQAGGTIENSRSEGYVKGEQQLVGGLIGDGAHADVDNRLVAEGTVIGGEIDPAPNADDGELNHEGVGGLIGRATWNTEVSTAYTRTDVEGDDYVGAIAGTSSYRDSTFEQMYTNGTASATSSDAGAVVGHVLSEGDVFRSSVYHDEKFEPRPFGEAGNSYRDVRMSQVKDNWIGRTTPEMQGLDVNRFGQMGNLAFEEDGGPWVAVPDEYPRFAWEAPEFIEFEIDSVTPDGPVTAGDAVDVDFQISRESQNVGTVTETVVLRDEDGSTVDTTEITIGEGGTASGTLQWRTDETMKVDEDGESFDLTVEIEDASGTDDVTVEPLDLDTGDPGDADGGGFEENETAADPGDFDLGSSAGDIDLGGGTEIDIDVIGVA